MTLAMYKKLLQKLWSFWFGSAYFIHIRHGQAYPEQSAGHWFWWVDIINKCVLTSVY